MQGAPAGGAFAPVFNAQTSQDGTFIMGGLRAGTYQLCIQGLPEGLLDPCFWSAKPLTQSLASGATITGLNLVALQGVALDIRVVDAQRLLAAQPKLNDIVIGVAPLGNRPFVPARTVSVDNSGRTLRVNVPKDKLLKLSVDTAALSLSDDRGTSYAASSTLVQIPQQALQFQGPVLTINVNGSKPAASK
jgi:hypothetical protein